MYLSAAKCYKDCRRTTAASMCNLVSDSFCVACSYLSAS